MFARIRPRQSKWKEEPILEKDEVELLTLWGQVEEKYRIPFKMCRDAGGIMEFLEDGRYMLLLGVYDATAEEIHNISNGAIKARILEPPAGTPLFPKVFSSLFMFGSFGPIDILFNPALYDKTNWAKFARLNRETNTVLFCSMDTKNWIWTSIRLATMPLEWREKLAGWWDFLENNLSSIDRERYNTVVNAWKTEIDAEDLPSLWRKGKNGGSFGEYPGK